MIIVAFLTGILASLGLGGGMILLVYLTVFANMPQIEAQGINLVFFIPLAILSVIIHTKNGLIQWDKVKPALFTGIIGALIGSYLAGILDTSFLSKVFGAFILIIGCKEFFTKSPERKKKLAEEV